jgi:hypothetical protein
MVYRSIKTFKLALIFLIVCGNLPAQAGEKEHLLYSYIPGIRHTAVRDHAYSPLLYSGIHGVYAIGYSNEGPRVSDHVSFSFAAGNLTNAYGKKVMQVGGDIQTYKFYHAGANPGEGVHWGWSNHNAFETRDIKDISNFNNRSEYFTSFGPAMRFRLPFSLFDRRFRLEMLADMQLLGFKLQSSYVTSTPPGFAEPSNTGITAFLRSVDLFYPGNAWNLGVRPALTYAMKNGNMLCINYRYEYRWLKGAHITESSSGSWHFGVITRL